MAILLSCRDIKKDFGDKSILSNISFDIVTGERIGLVGLNGSGKTTLANIIAGRLEMDAGSLIWHKKSVNIGYLRQESAYVENLFDEANIKDYLHASSTLGLKKVVEWDDEKFKNLSGGEKTKLSLSEVWSLNPDFLILDEPTNHLDYEGVRWLVKELKKYNQINGPKFV
jgi:macrolide transport system ATP-binding/permease protein